MDVSEERVLTRRRERFCREYVKDFNGARAARDAGYAAESADVEGSRLLVDARVAARVAELIAEREAADSVTEERIIQELNRIAFVNQADLASWADTGVTLNGSDTLTPDQTAAIAEVQQTKSVGGGSIKLKFHSKEKALELLMRHKGMLKDVGSAQNPLTTAAPVPALTPEAAAKQYQETLAAAKTKPE